MWRVALLLSLSGIYGLVYLITSQGKVLISGPEYSYHNSDLKLMCLTSAYSLGPFQPSMLCLEEATAAEIADLPVQSYWSQVDSEMFYRVARSADLAQILNRMNNNGRLHQAWKVIRESFRKHRSDLSQAVNLGSLSDAVLKMVLESSLLDPYALMLQYSSNLATRFSEALNLNRDTQPLWLCEHFFRHVPFKYQSHKIEFYNLVVNFFRLAQDSELDKLGVWQYLDENYKIRADSRLIVSALLMALINSIEYAKLSEEQLASCIVRYTSYTGLVFKLELTGKPSHLAEYVQHNLDLNKLQTNIPLVFNGVGETLILLERVKPSWSQLTEAPTDQASFMTSLEAGHLSPGWVQNVLVKSEWCQHSLVWAMTWKQDFPTTIEFCNDILSNLQSFKADSALILVILNHLKRHPEDSVRLDLDCHRNAKNLLEWRILDSFFENGQLKRPSPIELKENFVTRTSHWTEWTEEDWREISDKQILDLVLLHGLAPIYNQLSPLSRQALRRTLTRATFDQPGFSSNIRLGQINEDLAARFISWMMPLFDSASFWESVTPEDVEKLITHWPMMSAARFINGRPSKMERFVMEQRRTPILTTNRRPFDYIQDVIAANPGINDHSMLVEMSDAHWRNHPNSDFQRELKDFLTCPMASRRRKTYKEHPFWIALHETIDLRLLSELDWLLIGSMAHERNLESVLVAGYLMGCPIQFPSDLVPGLPFPDWMSNFSQQEKFTWLEQFIEGNAHLQEGLLLAMKWNTQLVLPESLVDLIATKYASAGWRKDLALLVLDHKLRNHPLYEFPTDTPPTTSLLFNLLQ